MILDLSVQLAAVNLEAVTKLRGGAACLRRSREKTSSIYLDEVPTP